MRAEQMKAKASDHYKELKPRSATRRRPPPGRDRAGPSTRLPGLRWVAAPLAALAAVIGALVIGTLQGQVASANSHQPAHYQAGGLSLTVGTTLWMSNDMSGQGPGRAPKGYTMPASEMPGIQPVGDNRLRVEITLNNVSSSAQRYSTSDFTLTTAGGKTFQVDPQGFSVLPASGHLEPGFGTFIDFYFDLPAQNSKHLTLKWSRGGTTVSIPVNTGGTTPGGMHM